MISDFKHGVILGIYIRFQGGTHDSPLLMDEIRGIHHLDVQKKHVVHNANKNYLSTGALISSINCIPEDGIDGW